MSTADAVRLESVARRFGRRWALRGVSLHVPAGQAVVLLGRNGSGKTTLLRVLATALRPTRGGGTVFGHDLSGDADGVRRHVGLLGHETGLYGDLTAAENLEFALRMRGILDRDARIQAALEAVGLGGAAQQRVRGFSAGMKRRLALGRLVMLPPRLLLLDEPYAAFDAAGIDYVHAFARAVSARGGAVIVSTHDPERAASLGQRWLRMDAGRIQEMPDAPATASRATAGAHTDEAPMPGVGALS